MNNTGEPSADPYGSHHHAAQHSQHPHSSVHSSHPQHPSASHGHGHPSLPPPIQQRLPPMPSMSPSSHAPPHQQSQHSPYSTSTLPPPGQLQQQQSSISQSASHHGPPGQSDYSTHPGTMQQSHLPPAYGQSSASQHGNSGVHGTSQHSGAPGGQLVQSHQASAQPLSELTKVYQGRRYKLSVVQQPKRARMCGFGDKDRRPITPPPCVRLIVTDDEDGKPTNDNDIPYLCFVCHVSLWSEDGARELDIVRHSSGNPSISSTTTASYASIQESASPAYTQMMPSSRPPSYMPQMAFGSMPSYGMGYGQQAPAAAYMHNGYSPANTYYPNDYRGGMMSNVMGGGMGYSTSYGPTPDQTITRSSGPQGMFTRNLVGQSVVSAQRLTDTEDKVGVWFILHDLSVRTEGNFRLKFTVVNIAADNNSAVMAVNQGTVPVLASCFSDTFTVFSAKKFPGVCESTALSKCFATQGIKIPIRKEGGADKNNNDDDFE